MTPFHFGSSQKTLFGMHHAPKDAARSVGVVLCNPLGLEAVRGHRAYRQLAGLLNKARFHVLRFDYFGTGDSAGDSGDGDLGQWIEDIGTAADELKDITGVSKLSFVGLRLGASLALLAGEHRTDVDSVVLWDPVVSGPAYLEELRATHLEYLNQEFRSRATPGRPTRPSEAMGLPLTDAFVAGLAALDLTTLADCGAKSASIIVSHPATTSTRLRDHLTRLGVKTAHDEVLSESWNSDEAMNSAVVPAGIFQAILARMTPRTQQAENP